MTEVRDFHFRADRYFIAASVLLGLGVWLVSSVGLGLMAFAGGLFVSGGCGMLDSHLIRKHQERQGEDD